MRATLLSVQTTGMHEGTLALRLLHEGNLAFSTMYRNVPYFRDQTPHLISGRPQIIAAPSEGLKEINAALV